MLVALFVVFLHYVGSIGIRAVHKHRYLLGWSRMDAAALVLGMLALAAGILVLDLLVTWSNRVLVRQAFNHLFLVGLVSGWLAAFQKQLWSRPNVTQLLWMMAAAVIGYSFARSDTRLVHYAAWSCLLLSPLILLVTMPMFGWQSWSSKPGRKLLPPAEASGGTPVYFFIFDEWSFSRSTNEGQFLPHLKNLRELGDQSLFCRRAVSPSSATWQSLPAILFQTDKAYTLNEGEPKFQDREGTVSAEQMDNLFRLSKRYHYTTYHLGWFHAYHQLLGDPVDYCHVYKSIIDLVADQGDQSNYCPVSHEKCLETGLLGKVLYGILGIFPCLTDPLSNILWHRLDPSIMCRQWFLMAERYRKEMLHVLAESPRRTFAFFHTPWPHAPFVFSPDGSYTGSTRDSRNAADYQRHILYVDHLVGEIARTLRDCGKFDDALLIITSDHSWRWEPDQALRSLPRWDRSVPLLIKLPGQHGGQVIEDELCNNQLAPLLEAVLSGKTDGDELRRLLQQISARNSASECVGSLC